MLGFLGAVKRHESTEARPKFWREQWPCSVAISFQRPSVPPLSEPISTDHDDSAGPIARWTIRLSGRSSGAFERGCLLVRLPELRYVAVADFSAAYVP